MPADPRELREILGSFPAVAAGGGERERCGGVQLNAREVGSLRPTHTFPRNLMGNHTLEF